MRAMMKVNAADLLLKRGLFEERWGYPEPAPYRYAPERGFHIYAKLNLQLELSAADDTSHAQQYLKVIQAYAAIAEVCGQAAGAMLLEVQGEVIHLLMPGNHDAATTARVFAFCRTLNDIVYTKLSPMAGDNWRSFVMGTDHGDAVLIESGNGSSDSIVSLGPAANHPAKQLPGTDAGHLAIRTDTLSLVAPVTDRRKEWTQCDLRTGPSIQQQRLSNDQAFIATDATMRALSEQVIRESRTYSPTVNMRIDEDVVKTAGITSPVRVQGFYMRADLDGFTADVQAAFEQGDEAVRALVERFTVLMGFADAFAESLSHTVIRLPWAGDCANMVVLSPDPASYRRDRACVPAVVPARWHSTTGAEYTDGKRWRDLLGQSDWSVSTVGGNDVEGNNGLLLVADVMAKERQFRIAAGWGARRSLDALDTAGVRKRDTVIHRVDYTALSSNYQSHFRALNSLFYRAEDLTSEKVTRKAVAAEAATSTVALPSVGVTLPRQEPHYEDG